jgi:glycosyltransferase involved in cell wall biosynthesis
MAAHCPQRRTLMRVPTTNANVERVPPGRSLCIAVVTETYPPEINGVATTMRQLVTGLQRLGHRVMLVRPRQPREQWRATTVATDVQDPMSLVLVPGLPIPGYRGLRFGLPVGRRLRRVWQRRRPDAIYIATQGPLGHAALAVARMADIPVLTGFHTQFHQYSRHYGLGLLMKPIVGALRRFHNASDATLVPTATLEHELEGDGFRNLQVFSRGVDTELFTPARRSQALRRAWGCSPDTAVALYVGRIAAEKNIELAIDAFQAMVAAEPSTRIVLVGDGPELAHLRRAHPDFRFTGALMGEALATHYASADLFVFPSLTETFGNVVIEAMACALPVIAFDYAAAGEHIRSGENGLTMPVGDRERFIGTAVDALHDRQRLNRLGRAARSKAESLEWERVIRGVEQRLFEVIERHSYPGGRHEIMAATTK